jgi:predicted amidophosphoribosyltransferase
MDAIITLTDVSAADRVDSGVVLRPYRGAMRSALVVPTPIHLASCRSLAAYDDAREAVLALKNGGERALVTPLADRLAALVPSVDGLVVTWAPTGASRRAHRGFDQAELLARAVARRRRLRTQQLLRRQPGPAQAGATGAERRRQPRFEARRCHAPVLLIDDVLTTGATLSAAARALLASGAPEVHGLVVARAPRIVAE